jgi:exodeoxyribonuclease VII large subunit
MAINQHLLKERHRLELLEQRATSLDPALLLKRGYSITLYKGHAVRNAASLKPGDQIETRLNEGTIHSTVLP